MKGYLSIHLVSWPQRKSEILLSKLDDNGGFSVVKHSGLTFLVTEGLGPQCRISERQKNT